MADGGPPLVVGVDARLRSGEAGGVEQFIIGLASGLSQLTDRDQFVFLCLPGEEGWLAPYVSGPCRIVLADTRPGRLQPLAGALKRRVGEALPWLRSARRRVRRTLEGSDPKPSHLSRALEEAGAQVIHFPHQSAFVTDLPSIYQPWDLQHLHLPQFFTPADIASREHTYRLSCARAERVVVASEWAKLDFIEQYDLDPDKVVVIPVPAPIGAYPELGDDQAAEIRMRLSLPPHFAFYPAQTWQHKNHIRLLQALAIIRESHGVQIPLVCSGRKNEHFPAIAAEVQRLGLDSQVRFLGYISAEEVQVLYRDASVLAFPSMFEGWGLPVVEALASRLPVACSRVTSLPELVGDAAILFDPGDPDDVADALWRLWTDAGLQARLAERGKARVHDLDWASTARAFRAVYRRATG